MSNIQRSTNPVWLTPQLDNTADTPKRLQRKIEILEAARTVLAEQGYTKFTLRRIAAEAGIHLKSLQRYFPTKRELLTAALEYIVQNYYNDQYARIFEHEHVSAPKEQLIVVIDYLLTDLKSAFTTRFFAELWALASHDDDAAAALDNGYTQHRTGFARLILAMNPTLLEKTVAHRAVIIAMLLEGLMLVIGHGKPHHDEFEGLNNEVRERIIDIVMAP